jgi:hypothetical protein
MSNDKNDFFLHSNEVNHIAKEDYDKIELLVNTAKAFARSTYQCVYIIDYFTPNLAKRLRLQALMVSTDLHTLSAISFIV